MEELVLATLHELLRYRRSSVEATSSFQSLKHNDYLCPRFSAQLCEYLEGSRRYQNVAYDVQGLRDRGKDVLLRLGEDEDSSTFVTFQIKSFDDLADKGYLRTVKAQAFEVREDFGDKLEHHFMVLCTDLGEHRDQVRNICAEFAKAEWATVIEPQYALTFLRLSTTRIDAIVQSVMREDDAVFKSAAVIVAEFAPLDIAILLCLLWLVRKDGSYAVDPADLRSMSFLDDALTFIPDVDRDDFYYDEDDVDAPARLHLRDRHRAWEERISESLEVLDGGPIDLDPVGDLVLVSPVQSVAIEAVMIDAIARFELEGDELVRFVFDAMDVARSFDLDFDLPEA